MHFKNSVFRLGSRISRFIYFRYKYVETNENEEKYRESEIVTSIISIFFKRIRILNFKNQDFRLGSRICRFIFISSLQYFPCIIIISNLEDR